MKKKGYFQHKNRKYCVKYVSTHYGFKWINLKMRIMLIWKPAEFYGEPSHVLELLEKAKKTIFEVLKND